MNTESRIKSAVKKGDIFLVLLLSGLCLFWFAFSLFGEKESIRMEIYLDGEAEVSVELSSLKKGESYIVGGCEIYADSEGVRFVSSCCEDRLCIKRGLMTRQGDTMACVPERVVVVLRGVSKADAIAY